MANDKNTSQDKDKVGGAVYACYVLCMLISIAILGKIVYTQLFYNLDPSLIKYFKPKNKKVILKPERGSILALDGRLLAMSTPMYQIGMDCAVLKEEFKNHPDKEKIWRDKAKELAKGLSSIYKDKSADAYYSMIISNRNNNKRYCKIGGQIDYQTLVKIKKLPLFNEGPYKGGINISKIDTRKYPYGTLARRTIGYVKDNDKSNGNNLIGIEGKFNEILHGKEGYEWKKIADNRGSIHNYDSSYVKAENGKDIRTTIDIDIQDIADKALRNQIEDSPKVSGGCAVVMDVHTGGIRAMVNLIRDSVSRKLNEELNMAIGRVGEPGSVFKLVTLMSLIEKGKIHLDDNIPTNKGVIPGFKPDVHISDYERINKTNEISIIHGFEISSNYVFRKVAIDNYGKNPQELLDKIADYNLNKAYDFDIEGLKCPTVPSMKSKYWSNTDLGSIAIGYSITETPLHILTLYNSVANKGIMMKPYLVESIEDRGEVIKEFGPKEFGRVCSKATADTLTRALKRVTQSGTAKYSLSKSSCVVAGKTGTARIAQPNGGYTDYKGRVQYQATFVGFFPADNPKYSAIVVLYSYPGTGNLYGGTLPARTFREIVDKLYVLDSKNGKVLYKKGSMPKLG